MSKSGAFHSSDTDWNSVTVLHKKAPAQRTLKTQSDVNAAKRSGAELDTEKKWAASTNKQHTGPQNATKIDAMTEPDHVPTVKLDVGRAIMQARQAKELSQKELAQKINEQTSVIADYEQGRGIPNQQVLSKLERMLGVKLRGKDGIGQPLAQKASKSKK